MRLFSSLLFRLGQSALGTLNFFQIDTPWWTSREIPRLFLQIDRHLCPETHLITVPELGLQPSRDREARGLLDLAAHSTQHTRSMPPSRIPARHTKVLIPPIFRIPYSLIHAVNPLSQCHHHSPSHSPRLLRHDPEASPLCAAHQTPPQRTRGVPRIKPHLDDTSDQHNHHNSSQRSALEIPPALAELSTSLPLSPPKSRRVNSLLLLCRCPLPPGPTIKPPARARPCPSPRKPHKTASPAPSLVSQCDAPAAPRPLSPRAPFSRAPST